jgi:hypothetical protein
MVFSMKDRVRNVNPFIKRANLFLRNVRVEHNVDKCQVFSMVLMKLAMSNNKMMLAIGIKWQRGLSIFHPSIACL